MTFFVRTFLLLTFSLLSTQLSHAASTIKIDGSSTVFPITEAVSEEFQTKKKGDVRVTVGISGTGGGFKKFCRGETDVQNASRPISAAEMETCRQANIKYYELPIGFDAIAVVVNPKNNWVNEISVDDLKKIWAPEAQGKISSWKQVNAAWPEQKLSLYGAGSDSGTFDYFTEAVVGKAKASRGDYTGSEDDNTLVMGVSNDKGALGYLPYSYYEANKQKLKLLGIIGGAKAPSKKAVLPSESTVIKGTYFPLSRPIFIYVNEAAYGKAEVKEYVDFYLTKGAELVRQVKYIPLPAKAYTIGKEHLQKKKLGSAFKGEAHIGLTIEQILKREAAL